MNPQPSNYAPEATKLKEFNGVPLPSHYQVLGITPDCTREDVRRAHRTKVMDAENMDGPESEFEDRLDKIKLAYEVLSDVRKKEVYDKGGDKALRSYEEASILLPAAWAAKLSTMGDWTFLAVLLLVLIFFMSIPFLLALRIDGVVSAKYQTVMLPLWVLDILLILSLGNAYHVPPPGIESQALVQTWAKFRPLMYIFLVIKLICFVIFQMLVAMKLDANTNSVVTIVFIPWYCFEGATILEGLMLMYIVWQLKIEHEKEVMFKEPALSQRLLEEESIDEDNMFNVCNEIQERADVSIKRSIVRLAFAILLSLKIQGVMDVSWGLVFLPVWLELGTQILVVVSDLVFLCGLRAVVPFMPRNRENTAKDGETQSVSSGANNPALDGIEEEVEAPSITSLFFQVVWLSVIAATFILACIRLESGFVFSTLYILIPGLILVLLLVLSLIAGRLDSSTVERPKTA